MSDGNSVEPLANVGLTGSENASSDSPSPKIVTAQSVELKRPKSAWAQIIQALVAALALVIAVIAYYETVRPAQQLIRANENLIVAEKRLTDAKNGLTDVEKELTNRRQQLADTEAKARQFAIDEFIRLVLSRTASIPHISYKKPSGGRYGTEPFRLLKIYFPALRQMFGENWQSNLNIDYFSGEFTGKGVIRDILAGPLLNILPEKDREPFVKRVNTFLENYSDKAAFDTQFANPVKVSPEENYEAFGREEARRMEAHKQFVAAVVKLREALRSKAEP